MDASAFVEYLLRTPLAGSFGDHLEDPDANLHVPALCDVEVVAAMRRILIQRQIGDDRAAQVLIDYVDLPIIRHGHLGLLSRMVELKDNFTAYDATYVALAEVMTAELITGDDGLAQAAREQSSLTVHAPH
ncbi:MAG: type II toxin-antitoxin system VapC family toxin [Actinomycetota bacterium]